MTIEYIHQTYEGEEIPLILKLDYYVPRKPDIDDQSSLDIYDAKRADTKEDFNIELIDQNQVWEELNV